MQFLILVLILSKALLDAYTTEVQERLNFKSELRSKNLTAAGKSIIAISCFFLIEAFLCHHAQYDKVVGRCENLEQIQ